METAYLITGTVFIWMNEIKTSMEYRMFWSGGGIYKYILYKGKRRGGGSREKYHYACSNWKEKLAKVTCGFILKSQLAAGLQADVP